jgi:hypothetical protein
MDHSIFDESIFEEEQEQVDELDFVKYAYGRHVTADIFDGHPLAAQDEFLTCLARHGASEPNASVVRAESADEAPAAIFD